MRVSLNVPATSANLGPGYDSFGLALDLSNRFSAELAPEWGVEVVGEGAGTLATDGSNKIAQAMARTFEEAGEGGRCARIFCVNKIPPGQGLGSSAAAIVGGMLMADALSEVPLGRNRVFEMAAEMEGHPDNVAAALFGGMTISWKDDGPRCVALDPASGLATVVVFASEPLGTQESRHLLPDTVPHVDAARNAARAGLLVAGMSSGREDLIAAGLVDCIHERYRTIAVPDLAHVRSVLTEAGALGAVLSGAGPTVIALVHGKDDAAALDAAVTVAQRAGAALRGIPTRRPPQVIGIERRGTVLD